MDLYPSVDQTRKDRGYPPGEKTLSVFARALVDGSNNPVAFGDNTPEVVTTTNVITAAENGKTFFLSLAGGFTSTLPAVAAGLAFTFIVKTAPTTAYIILSATNDNIIGYPVASTGGDESANGNAAGDQINLIANVALPGDRVDLACDGTSWFATCVVKAAGACTITG